MAKMIKFNLTLSGATVSTFDELQDSFSAEILPIYRTGRLLKWLQARELTEQAQAVQAITLSDDDRELLGALCRALSLDDDTEVINFLLEDWQASQTETTKTAPSANVPKALTADEDKSPTNPTPSGIDWSGQNMEGRNFEGADFQNGIFEGTVFTDCILDGADFSGANLKGANLSMAKGRLANFKGANLSSAILSGCEFYNSNFDNCIFNEIIFSSGYYTKTYHRQMHAGTPTFTLCSFKDANFSSVNFSMNDRTLIFNYSDFENANFSFAENMKHSFGSCNLNGSNILGITGLDKQQIEEITESYLLAFTKKGAVQIKWPFSGKSERS